MTPPIIRRVGPEDMETSAETIRKSFATVADEFGLTRENCPTNGAFTRPIHLEEDLDNGCLLYGLYIDAKQVGFVELRPKGGGVFELTKLAVRPECRHHGYGADLVAHALSVVAENGGHTVTIGIIEENEVLKKWYLDRGFVHTGTKVFPTLPFTVGFMEYEVKDRG